MRAGVLEEARRWDAETHRKAILTLGMTERYFFLKAKCRGRKGEDSRNFEE